MSKKIKYLTINESKKILQSCKNNQNIPIKDYEDPVEFRINKEKNHIKCLAAMHNLHPNYKLIIFDIISEKKIDDIKLFLSITNASTIDYLTYMETKAKCEKTNFTQILKYLMNDLKGKIINDHIIFLYFNDKEINQKKFIHELISYINDEAFEYLLNIIGNDANMVTFLLSQNLTTDQKTKIFVNYIREESVPILKILLQYKNENILNNKNVINQSKIAYYNGKDKNVRETIRNLYNGNKNYKEVINNKKLS